MLKCCISFVSIEVLYLTCNHDRWLPEEYHTPLITKKRYTQKCTTPIGCQISFHESSCLFVALGWNQVQRPEEFRQGPIQEGEWEPIDPDDGCRAVSREKSLRERGRWRCLVYRRLPLRYR